ncbi:hypothetical protein E3V39_11755 [Gammaproteobacteria bacterium LSUCC0112]|nr:hypothetical protein E3V39_11755 [Gammaproteobacteria bacterium LSUCC0112]
MLSRQVIFPNAVASLADLDEKPALRNGRVFDATRTSRNSKQPRLWKVGLKLDVLVNEDDVLRTMRARQTLMRQRRLFSKLERYLTIGSQNRFRRVLGFTLGKLRHRIFNSQVYNPHIDNEWALVAGVNFWECEDGTFVCVDHGAIYEDFLTTDSSRFPSQVGTDLYTTSNSAFLFKWMMQRDLSSDWSIALDATKRYFEGFYVTPRQRLEFDHREFDYGALRLAFGCDLAAPFAGWTAYDPVNVFGLRWDNMALAPESKSVIRKAIARWVISLNQTHDGLIMDNHLGRAVNSGDLTYHQYCLAGLVLGNIVHADKKIDQVIKSGLKYSLAFQLPNGEIGFYGRGANNFYHLASFVAALAISSQRYSWNVSSSLQSAMTKLSSMLAVSSENLMFPPMPTAMNDSPVRDMVGWHGSCAQYGAHSAFLLARATSYLRQVAINGSKFQILPPFRPSLHPTHARIEAGSGDSRVVIVVTAGSECMRWNNGQHVSGYAGLTALVLGNINRLLTNERVLQDENQYLLISDIQDQGDQGSGTLCLFNNELHLTLLDQVGYRKIEYRVSTSSWSVSVFGFGIKAAYCLALKGRPSIERLDESNFGIFFEDGFSVNLNANQPVTFKLIKVQRSCQGAGTMLQILAGNDSLTLSFLVRKSKIKGD